MQIASVNMFFEKSIMLSNTNNTDSNHGGDGGYYYKSEPQNDEQVEIVSPEAQNKSIYSLSQMNSSINVCKSFLKFKKTDLKKSNVQIVCDEKDLSNNNVEENTQVKENIPVLEKTSQVITETTLKEGFIMGKKLLKQKKYIKAIIQFESILNKAKNHKNKGAEYAIYEILAKIYDKGTDLNKALTYFQKAFLLALHDKNFEKMARLSNNIASIYADQSDYKNSLLWYNRAKNYASKMNDSEAIEIINDSINLIKKQIYLLQVLAA